MRKYPPSLSGITSTVDAMQQRINELEGRMASLERQLNGNNSKVNEKSIAPASDGGTKAQRAVPGGYEEGGDYGKTAGDDDVFALDNAAQQIKTGRTDGSATSGGYGSGIGGELSQFVSGKAALKDFNILDESKRSTGNSNSLAGHDRRHASSASLYPSIRHTSPPSTSTSWRYSHAMAMQAMLPAMHTIRSAIQLYRDYYGWAIPAVNHAQLRAEVDELEHLLLQGLFGEVDPAWVALLFQVMAQGAMVAHMCRHSDSGTAGVEAITISQNKSEFAHRMADAAEGALLAAHMVDRPQVRVIQVLLLRARWLDHVDPESGLLVDQGQSGTMQGIGRNIALAHAQALGLHMLGSDRATMPELDPALPAHACEFRRQMGLRIWSTIEATFLLGGQKDINSDSALFDVCPGKWPDTVHAPDSHSRAPTQLLACSAHSYAIDADLRFSMADPRVNAETWETAFQKSHLAFTEDVKMGLQAIGSSLADLLTFEAVSHSRMEASKNICRALPARGLPPYWHDHTSEASMSRTPLSPVH